MKKKMTTVVAVAAVVVGLAGVNNALAVPTLQVGAPGGAGEGTYANYTGSLSSPTETDTAVTMGSTIYASGLYRSDSIVKLGGKYSGAYGTGDDWSALGFSSAFNGHGAVLLASVANGASLTNLTVNGVGAFYTSTTTSYFPNNHAPVGNGSVTDFLFFDIGDFAKSVPVPDFTDENAGTKLGQIKTLTLGGLAGYDWVHFDVMALETETDTTSQRVNGVRVYTTFVDDTDLEKNPGSHDVTWKKPPVQVPEPGTLLLLGSGLLGLAGFARRNRK